MKKWSILLVIGVFIFYIIGLFLKFNMIFPLIVLFMVICLPIYLDTNEKGIRTIRGGYNSFLEVQTHEIENRIKNYKTPTISTPIICALISVVLCFGHYMLFINENEVPITYNPNYYAEYISGYNSIRVYIDQESKDIVTSLVIVNTQKELQDNQPLNIYSDALIYKDILPITYNVATYSETIVLNLYMKEFDFKNAKEMFNYIGLENECHDSNLTFSEIKNSQSFKFKDVITNGEYKEIFYSKLESHDTGIKCN